MERKTKCQHFTTFRPMLICYHQPHQHYALHVRIILHRMVQKKSETCLLHVNICSIIVFLRRYQN